jgi:hypothetical protein
MMRRQEAVSGERGGVAAGRPEEGSMRYLMLIYGEEPATPPSQAEIDAEMAQWWDYDAAIKKAGVFLGGEALQPSHTATTARLKDGERVVTDGPFAETREVLGGFYLLDVPDLDTALDWAARCPAAAYGSLEIRPVMEFDQP